MKPLLSCLSSLVIIGSAIADVSKDRALAWVDGVPVKASEFQGALALHEPVLTERFHAEPERLVKEMAKLKRRLLDMLIDQQLLVNEFTRIGGITKPEFLEEAFTDFIKVHFKRSRKAFMADLAKRGLTEEQFRASQRGWIIDRVMFSRLSPGIKVTDEQLRDYYAKHKQYWGTQPFESVKDEATNALKVDRILKNLRDKAEIRKMDSD
jgi:hypothetical protein